MFALHAGLYDVVRAAIVGSILANVLLVLGLAFLVGGLRHGTQRFGTEPGPQLSLMLLVLAVAAVLVPALTATCTLRPAARAGALDHRRGRAAGLLRAVAAGIDRGARRRARTRVDERRGRRGRTAVSWPLWLAVGMLAAAGVAAALVSDWFVNALEPAIDASASRQAFAGLVIVAIAGNAVENVVGIQLAVRNQADYALSVIMQQPAADRPGARARRWCC